MKLDDIAIHTGKPDFEFTPIRRLEVKCEASNALMPAPTIEEANGRLRALAAKVGANAIVGVEYTSGISFTSWKSLKATGIAGTRASDEVACDVCAEQIKRAALKCRYCGTERDPAATTAVIAEPADTTAAQGAVAARASVQEPLRDNNNPAIIIGLVAFAIFVFFLILGAQ